MTVCLLLLGWAPPAWAGSIRPSREPLPARFVERELVVPRGWTRAELSLSRLAPRGTFGAPTGWLPTGPLTERRTDLVLRYGVLPRVELGAGLGWVWRGDAPEVVSGAADPELTARLALLRREPPNRSLALALAVRAPAGGVVDGVPLGTGTTALEARLGGRTQLGGLGFTGWAVAEADLPGRVAWLPAPAGHSTWLDPGDRVGADGSVLLQAGPLALEGRGGVRARGAARWREPHGRELTEAGATEVEVGARGTLQLTRGADLGLDWARPVVGGGSALVPLEELTPSRGPRWSARVGVAL